MTEMNNNDLDRLFREKFEGQETVPPDSAWTGIERELGKNSGRGGAGRWWISGITALVIGLAGWWYFGSSHLSSGQLAENRTNENNTQHTNSSSQNSIANETKNTSSENTNTPGSKADLKPVLADEKANSSVSPVAEAKNPQAKTDVPLASKSPQKNESIYPQNPRKQEKRNEDKQAATPSPGDMTAAEHARKGKYDDQRDPGPHVPAVVYDQQNPLAHDVTAPAQEKDPQLAKAGSAGEEKTAAADSLQKVTASEKAIADSALMAQMLASADKANSDSTKAGAEDAGEQPGQDDRLPAFFAGFHVSVEDQKISSSENEYEGFTRADVTLNGENSSPEIVSQSYSYGGRMGWFASKHLALVGGLYFNSFEMNSTGGSVKFNHNDEILFTMHSAASSVQLQSGSFSHEDSFYGPSDTFLIKLSSKENYSFVNFQLGASYYPWRNQRFGAYVNLLSNGAYLTKENMTLTSAKTGNSFRFYEEDMSGMNKFTLGAQVGTGFEFTPVPHFGIWIEPAYFFSASLNKKNAFALKPSAFRFQCGLAAHF